MLALMQFQPAGRTLLTDLQQPTGPIAESRPGGFEFLRGLGRFAGEGLGTTLDVDVDELHDPIHPGRRLAIQRGAPEGHDDLRGAAVDLTASDLDDAADGHGDVAAQVEDSFQDEIGIKAGGVVSRGISGLQGQREQGAGVERPVMVGVAGQDESVRERLGVVRVRRCHTRAIPRFRRRVSAFGRRPAAIAA